MSSEPTFNDPPLGAAAGPTPAAVSRASMDGVVEQFARDYLRDRRHDRRWRIFFRLAWLLLLAFVLYSLFSQDTSVSAHTSPHTAMVELNGVIAEDSDASAERVVSGLKSAFEDKFAQAVVLRINSPGGSPVQSGIINDEIRRLKAKHNKKLYAVVEDVCASGAYYAAVAADEIYVDKASIVGSIGVLMDGFGFTGTMDKLGIERRLMTAGENKAILDPFSPINDQQKVFVQGMLDQIHQQFIKVVKDGRGAKLKEAPDMFSGLFWNGEQALKLGLADKYGNVAFVAREVVKAETVVDYTAKDNVAERLAKRFGASVGAGAMQALRSAGGMR
jgi:protease IV